MKTNEEVIAMLHKVVDTVAGFDGVINTLLLVNDMIVELREEVTNEKSTAKEHD